MAQLPWHDYGGESAETLLALMATHRLDSLAVAFETALGQKAFKLGDGALSDVERDVLAIEGLEREVNNGGYGQFFGNSSNEYAGIIVPALQRIGCARTATITEQAIAALPEGTALSPASLEDEMARPDDERDERLEACNQAYFTAGEDIAAALMAYLDKHRGELRLL
jgi:hypothetical protein